MSVAIITGAGGLIGSQAVETLSFNGLDIVGIDNDMRGVFFGPEASTRSSWIRLQRTIPTYVHKEIDIRDAESIATVFRHYGTNITVVIHAAAQPSHDWAAREPITDFAINAGGTLLLLESSRKYCPGAVFVFCSTNKVYGDTPNTLPLEELESRWELSGTHRFGLYGIDETMSIDSSTHSVFGVSKCAADLLVQEYGRYFGIRTACFRCGCLTGPAHAGAPLHGFLSYLVKCAQLRRPYAIQGYQGKQTRDNLHASDLAAAFWEFVRRPGIAEVYNMGGGRSGSCSIREAISIIDDTIGHPMRFEYKDNNRLGDHKWWISDTRKFQEHYPSWQPRYDVRAIIEELCETINIATWRSSTDFGSR